MKRYLLAKRAWFAERRPQVRHTLVVPGATTRDNGRGVVSLAAVRLPFGDGYRCPASIKRWADRLAGLRPTLIEAGDPYGPGLAALEAGERTGAPVIGFCHTDPAALAALHLGSWAEPPVRRRWAGIFRRFDQVVAPSRHIAERLAAAGIGEVAVQPLGVDTDIFAPERGDRAALRRRLALGDDVRLLVFAGRPAREKNVEAMLDAVGRLGARYHLLIVGAGSGVRLHASATAIAFQREPRELARLLASCDAFLHANPSEPFGLAALEALASGLPVVGVASGGVAELIDDEVGQLAVRPTADALAQAIEALCARDLAAVSRAARGRAVERHGWNATFERLSRLYAELAPGVG